MQTELEDGGRKIPGSNVEQQCEVPKREATNHELGDVLPGERRGGLPRLKPPVGLVVLMVVGSVILLHSGIERAVPSMLVVALNQVFYAGLWAGAVWLGVVLAYRAIMRTRDDRADRDYGYRTGTGREERVGGQDSH
ncbi:MAG: hypothetical protein JXA87_15895 [Thermoleophilia bacterium]|nr:hypothetical protein [Thermoleophilia bacterium]